jgi:hypothetical protein
VRALDRLEPDFVLDTGDNLAHQDAVPYVWTPWAPARPPRRIRPGIQRLLGTQPKNPLATSSSTPRSGCSAIRSPGATCTNGLTRRVDRPRQRTGAGRRGRGRPGPGRGRRPARVPRPVRPGQCTADPSADVTIGVLHAPYRRVLDAMAADGAALIVAGHTHGGQLRVPGVGALVTNCDLPRQQARACRRGRARHCTCPRDSARRRTPRCASPAPQRRRCSPSSPAPPPLAPIMQFRRADAAGGRRPRSARLTRHLGV